MKKFIINNAGILCFCFATTFIVISCKIKNYLSGDALFLSLVLIFGFTIISIIDNVAAVGRKEEEIKKKMQLYYDTEIKDLYTDKIITEKTYKRITENSPGLKDNINECYKGII